MGLMIESNLEWGKQAFPKDPSQVKPGISVTDACLGWEATETALRDLRDKIKHVLPERNPKLRTERATT